MDQKANKFVIKDIDFSSEIPRLTTGIEHDIVTEPGVQVNVKLYRIPEAKH